MTLLNRIAVTAGGVLTATAVAVALAAPAGAYGYCTVECSTYGATAWIPCTGIWATPDSSMPTDQCLLHRVDRTVDVEAPEAATNLSGRPWSDGADLEWTASTSNDVTGYRIYVAAAVDGPYEWVTGVGTDDGYRPPTRAHVEQPPETTRYYRIAAIDDHRKESRHTSPVAVTTIAAASEPTGVQAETGTTAVRFSWNPNGEPVAGYVVQRWAHGHYYEWDGEKYVQGYGDHFQTLCRTTTTTCDVEHLYEGATYTFYVAAENAHHRVSSRVRTTVTTHRS